MSSSLMKTEYLDFSFLVFVFVCGKGICLNNFLGWFCLKIDFILNVVFGVWKKIIFSIWNLKCFTLIEEKCFENLKLLNSIRDYIFLRGVLKRRTSRSSKSQLYVRLSWYSCSFSYLTIWTELRSKHDNP